MKPSAILEILEAVDLLEADECAKQQFKQLVHAIGVIYGIRGLGHPNHVKFAGQLLSARTSRATIRDRLIAKYGVSRRQAYRTISDALKLCHRSAIHGTQSGSNRALDIGLGDVNGVRDRE
jgi:hypothetical protein